MNTKGSDLIGAFFISAFRISAKNLRFSSFTGRQSEIRVWL